MKFLNFNGLVKYNFCGQICIEHTEFRINHFPHTHHQKPKIINILISFTIIRAKNHVKVIRTVIIFLRFLSIVFIFMALL